MKIIILVLSFIIIQFGSSVELNLNANNGLLLQNDNQQPDFQNSIEKTQENLINHSQNRVQQQLQDNLQIASSGFEQQYLPPQSEQYLPPQSEQYLPPQSTRTLQQIQTPQPTQSFQFSNSAYAQTSQPSFQQPQTSVKVSQYPQSSQSIQAPQPTGGSTAQLVPTLHSASQLAQHVQTSRLSQVPFQQTSTAQSSHPIQAPQPTVGYQAVPNVKLEPTLQSVPQFIQPAQTSQPSHASLQQGQTSSQVSQYPQPSQPIQAVSTLQLAPTLQNTQQFIQPVQTYQHSESSLEQAAQYPQLSQSIQAPQPTVGYQATPQFVQNPYFTQTSFAAPSQTFQQQEYPPTFSNYESQDYLPPYQQERTPHQTYQPAPQYELHQYLTPPTQYSYQYEKTIPENEWAPMLGQKLPEQQFQQQLNDHIESHIQKLENSSKNQPQEIPNSGLSDIQEVEKQIEEILTKNNFLIPRTPKKLVNTKSDESTPRGFLSPASNKLTEKTVGSEYLPPVQSDGQKEFFNQIEKHLPKTAQSTHVQKPIQSLQPNNENQLTKPSQGYLPAKINQSEQPINKNTQTQVVGGFFSNLNYQQYEKFRNLPQNTSPQIPPKPTQLNQNIPAQLARFNMPAQMLNHQLESELNTGSNSLTHALLNEKVETARPNSFQESSIPHFKDSKTEEHNSQFTHPTEAIVNQESHTQAPQSSTQNTRKQGIATEPAYSQSGLQNLSSSPNQISNQNEKELNQQRIPVTVAQQTVQTGTKPVPHLRKTETQLNKPKTSTSIYSFASPDENEEEIEEEFANLGPARKNYRVVFIKAPNQITKNTLRIAQALNSEEQTVIYVLSKKTDSAEIQKALETVPKPTTKPEVRFIKYKTNEEAVSAQRQIQAQYDALGGNTRIDQEEIAPTFEVDKNFAEKEKSAYLPPLRITYV